MSFTFIATQSIPIVSYLRIMSAMMVFDPTPSVQMAIPTPSISITLAKYPIGSSTRPWPERGQVFCTRATIRLSPASASAVSTPDVLYISLRTSVPPRSVMLGSIPMGLTIAQPLPRPRIRSPCGWRRCETGLAPGKSSKFIRFQYDKVDRGRLPRRVTHRNLPGQPTLASIVELRRGGRERLDAAAQVARHDDRGGGVPRGDISAIVRSAAVVGDVAGGGSHWAGSVAGSRGLKRDRPGLALQRGDMGVETCEVGRPARGVGREI